MNKETKRLDNGDFEVSYRRGTSEDAPPANSIRGALIKDRHRNDVYADLGQNSITEVQSLKDEIEYWKEVNRYGKASSSFRHEQSLKRWKRKHRTAHTFVLSSGSPLTQARC